MRLIDADALKEHVKKYTSVFAKYDWREICEMLNDAPTVDAVEVVRCKDCRWYENDGYHTHCRIMRLSVEAEDYCSRGERREDGKTN